MKKTEIILAVIIALVAGIIIMTFNASNESVTFAEAAQQMDKKVKIVGSLDKTEMVEYNPTQNPNRTAFYVLDKSGQKCQVELIQKDGKPMGLEQSESLTIEGKMGADQVFHADFMLMKCPSKYNEQQHSLK
jgi:cytochrome c-type biogenesis protein CcmE